MNVQLRETAATQPSSASRLSLADCDIHPATRSDKDLHPWLERRWTLRSEKASR